MKLHRKLLSSIAFGFVGCSPCIWPKSIFLPQMAAESGLLEQYPEDTHLEGTIPMAAVASTHLTRCFADAESGFPLSSRNHSDLLGVFSWPFPDQINLYPELSFMQCILLYPDPFAIPSYIL